MPDAAPPSSIARSLLYLAVAMAISVILVFPVEQTRRAPAFSSNFWTGDPTCGGAVALLDRGLLVQAILAPLLLFLLPGAGSIIGNRTKLLASGHAANARESRGSVATAVIGLALLIVCPFLLLVPIFGLTHFHLDSSPLINSTIIFELVVKAAAGILGIVAAVYLLREHMKLRPVLFFVAGWLFAAVIPVAWWYGLKDYAAEHGLCQQLFHVSAPVDFLRTDYLYDSYRYFLYLSVFCTIWVGTAAAGLRLQAERAADNSPAGSELRAFHSFFWVYLLGWMVQYRVSLWLTQPTPGTNVEQEWLTWALLTFVYLTASSLWTLAFIRWFWKWRITTWWASVAVAFAAAWAIPVLTMLTFFWLFLWAPLALVPFFSGNVCGLLWALTVGTWRWMALQRNRAPDLSGQAPPLQPGAVPSGQPSSAEPALPGLKAVQIVAIGVAIFLFLALLITAVVAYGVLHSRSPHFR